MPSNARRILFLIALAVCTYLPALRLPFIEDDYGQIPRARQFAAQGWTPLWHDVNLRARATYVVLSAALDRWFGFTPQPFYAASLLLHAICVLLLYAAAVRSGLGATAAFWAAAFFAIYEGHQEAVMWLAASSDLLVFLFGMAAWICWAEWLSGGRWPWYAAAVSAFLLALASKESAWVFPLLMLIPVAANRQNFRRGLAGILPFLAVAAGYAAWSWITRVAPPGYHDQRFSVSLHWPLVILTSFGRLVFVWGLIFAAILLWKGSPRGRRDVWTACLWMLLGILPYSFLSYLPYIPSRHVYLASAGLAFLAGSAAARLIEDRRRTLLVALGAVVLISNLEIIWVKKMAQYRERAEPYELLKQAAARASGPVLVECSPLYDFMAKIILEQAGSQAALSPNMRQDVHCFAIQYRDAAGNIVRLNRRLATEKHGAFY